MNGTVGRASILLGHYTLPSSAPLPLLHIILRTKTDDIPTKSTSSSSSGGNKHSSQSHSSPSHSHSSHSQHTSSSHSHSRGSGSHRGYSSSSTHHSSHHTSHSSQGHHDRMRERDRGHGRCASHPSTVLCVHSQYVHLVFFLVSRSSLSPSSLTNSCSSLHVEIVQPLFFPPQFLYKFSVLLLTPLLSLTLPFLPPCRVIRDCTATFIILSFISALSRSPVASFTIIGCIALLHCHEDRIRFYLRGTMQWGNATYCEPTFPVSLYQILLPPLSPLSHRRSNRGSRSSSKSASVSPTSSGRGRGPHDKATPNRHPSSRPHHGGRGGSKRGSVSPRVSAAGKQQSSVSTVAVSPCTPSIPHGISQVISLHTLVFINLSNGGFVSWY